MLYVGGLYPLLEYLSEFCSSLGLLSMRASEGIFVDGLFVFVVSLLGEVEPGVYLKC